MANELCTKLESAFRQVIIDAATGFTDAQLFTGQSIEEKVLNRVEFHATQGPEFPPNSGNRKIIHYTMVRGRADRLAETDPDPRLQHNVAVGEVFDALCVTRRELSAALSLAVPDITVFDLMEHEMSHGVGDDHFVDMLAHEVYCCGSVIA